MRSVKIINETGDPRDTKIVSKSGRSITGVTKVALVIDPEQPVTADLTLVMAICEVKCQPRFIGLHPETGEMKQVKSIQFDDGTTWEA